MLTKRIIDLLIVLIFLFPAALMVLLFAIIIVLQFGTPPFFIQKRGITNKNKFYIIKLRTLKPAVNAHTIDTFNKEELSQYTTSFSSWLRKTGLDELPQFLNILLGHMSLVGPRPFSEADIKSLECETPEFYKRRINIHSKPGLTGLWQIYGDRNLGVSNLLQLEEDYEKNRNLLLDLKIMLQTVPFMLNGRKRIYKNLNAKSKQYQLKPEFNYQEQN